MAIMSEWPIRNNGEIIPAGTNISLAKKDEKRLVKAGIAKYVKPKKTPSQVENEDKSSPNTGEDDSNANV